MKIYIRNSSITLASRVAQSLRGKVLTAAASTTAGLRQGAAATGVDEPDTSSLFGEEHRALRAALRRLIDSEINPHVEEWERARRFPAHHVFKLLGAAGFLGVNKPPEYGGLGLDYSFNVAVAEELGAIRCGGIPMAIGVQSDMATPALARFGSHELKEKFLAPTISGDIVACLGVSESTAGSDVSGIKTRADIKKGGDLIINGSKMWITNGHQADWMCMLANTAPAEDSPRGIHGNKSLICVPLDLPGVERGEPLKKLGMHSSDTVPLTFDNVRVPRSHIIGDMGHGFTYQMMQFQEERMYGVAASLLPLDMLIHDTADYTRQRKIFGGSVLQNQVVHFRLAELQTEVEALRALLYRAVALYVRGGQDVTLLASMAKLKAGRLVREVSDSCLQYWGGMGYTEEVLVSRLYRDFRLLSIGAGADEVMLSIICKFMGTLPSQKRSKSK